jgi:hypothetical protein
MTRTCGSRMVLAPFINWPDTLPEIGYPVAWEPERFLAVMGRAQAAVSSFTATPT